MPRATVTHDTTRINLKSAPPDGYVDLRTLSFHEMTTRQDIATRMYQEQSTGKGKKKNAKDEETIRGYFEIMNVAVTEYEFRNCIVAHNLEDENGELIDFTRPMQAWRLDPKVGQEIDSAIEKMNQFDEEGEDDLAPLSIAPSSFSSDEASLQPTSSTSE
jgi:hypothetical protein